MSKISKLESAAIQLLCKVISCQKVLNTKKKKEEVKLSICVTADLCNIGFYQDSRRRRTCHCPKLGWLVWEPVWSQLCRYSRNVPADVQRDQAGVKKKSVFYQKDHTTEDLTTWFTPLFTLNRELGWFGVVTEVKLSPQLKLNAQIRCQPMPVKGFNQNI